MPSDHNSPYSGQDDMDASLLLAAWPWLEHSPGGLVPMGLMCRSVIPVMAVAYPEQNAVELSLTDGLEARQGLSFEEIVPCNAVIRCRDIGCCLICFHKHSQLIPQSDVYSMKGTMLDARSKSVAVGSRSLNTARPRPFSAVSARRSLPVVRATQQDEKEVHRMHCQHSIYYTEANSHLILELIAAGE